MNVVLTNSQTDSKAIASVGSADKLTKAVLQPEVEQKRYSKRSKGLPKPSARGKKTEQTGEHLESKQASKLSDCNNTDKQTLPMHDIAEHADSKLDASPFAQTTPMRPKMRAGGLQLREGVLRASLDTSVGKGHLSERIHQKPREEKK